MSTNSNSKCKLLLCLALPLTVAAGHASDSYRAADAHAFTDFPAPTVAAVSKTQALDIAINNEIFYMVLAETDNDYNLSASVNDQVVTLKVTSLDRTERQRVVNEVWTLSGVKQVKNEMGVNTPSTKTAKLAEVL